VTIAGSNRLPTTADIRIGTCKRVKNGGLTTEIKVASGGSSVSYLTCSRAIDGLSPTSQEVWQIDLRHLNLAGQRIFW